MNVEILNQFPSPPVPNLPALAMAMAPVMPQHQQPMMNTPPISMAMPTPTPPVMAIAPVAPAQAPTNTNFIPSFPPVQVTVLLFLHYTLILVMIIIVILILPTNMMTQATKSEDDDFQDFQEAPKTGGGDQAFSDFQGESGGSFPTTIAPQHQNRWESTLFF